MTDYGRIEYEREREGSGNGHGGITRRDTEGQTVTSLVTDLIGETLAFIQAEAALARAELRQNVESVRRGMTAIGGGTGLLHAGLLALVAAAILLLDRVWPAWVAALVVGAVAVAVGIGLVMYGKRRALKEGLVPERTIGALGEMRELARQEKVRTMRKWQ